MNRVLAIALNTFREAVRDKVLYGVVGLASAFLVFTLALAELSLGQEARVVADVGLASISLFSIVVAVFLGSSLLYKEIERKTLYVILPKPIERWEFLVGKFFGIALTGAVFVVIMGAIQLWVAAVQAGSASTTVLAGVLVAIGCFALAFRVRRDVSAILVPWSLAAFALALFAATRAHVALTPIVGQLVLCIVELSVIASIALLFSSFSTPFLTGGFTTGVFVLGRSVDSMITMPAAAVPPEVKSLLRGLSWVVPNGDLFVPGHNTFVATVSGTTPVVYILEATGYGAAYVVVVLMLASVIFARRDFA